MYSGADMFILGLKGRSCCTWSLLITVSKTICTLSWCQGMKQTIQCLQDQLNLLTMETQKDYSDLCSASRSLQRPVQVLQENISR